MFIPPRNQNTLQFQIIGMGGWGLGWGLTGNLNTNKQGGPNKRARSEKCSRSKVTTRYH